MVGKKYSWLELLFRQDKVDDLKRLRDTHKRTLGKINTANLMVSELEDVLHIYQTVDIPFLESKVIKATGQAAYYKGLWEDALHIPNIKTHLTDPTLYHPLDDDINRPLSYSGVSDHLYHVYSKETWSTILSIIHKEVKDEMPRWIREISDCDNYAKIMISAVQLAFIEAGEPFEAAFGYALGREGAKFHAYNFFRTSSGEFYLYEPQDGSIICMLGEGVGVYQTFQISL